MGVHLAPVIHLGCEGEGLASFITGVRSVRVLQAALHVPHAWAHGGVCA